MWLIHMLKTAAIDLFFLFKVNHRSGTADCGRGVLHSGCGFHNCRTPLLEETPFNESLSACFCNLMLNCVWASCLEEAGHTTETHAKQKALVGTMMWARCLCQLALQRPCQPFINALFGKSLAQQCLSRFWFKYPLQM